MKSRKTPPRVKVPLAREELEVSRKKVDTGTVRVSKSVNERVEHVSEASTREEVVLERVAVNRMVERPGATRVEGDVVVIPIFEEIVTVERKWLLKEELRISKRRVEAPFEQDVTLREEKVVVEREPAGDGK